MIIYSTLVKQIKFKKFDKPRNIIIKIGMDADPKLISDLVLNSENDRKDLLDIPKSSPESPYFAPSFDYETDNDFVNFQPKAANTN